MGEPESSARSRKSPREFYRGLSPRARVGLWVLVVVELILIALTQRDIQTRPAPEVRGPKWLWRAIATQNVVGPALYYAIGRRSNP